MLAGFILGLSVGIFIAGFVYIFMDSKLYELRNKYATVFKQSTIKWRDIKWIQLRLESLTH